MTLVLAVTRAQWRSSSRAVITKSLPWLQRALIGGAGAQRLMSTTTKNLRSLMSEQAVVQERQLTLPEMLQFGENANRHTVLMHAMFLQQELPMRLARRIAELRSLPRPMLSTTALRSLIALYEDSFVRIIDHEPPENSKMETAFSATLANIKEEHRSVHAMVAAAFVEMQHSGAQRCSLESSEVQELLTRFYRGRIGVRLLMDQHLSLRLDAASRIPGMAASPRDIVCCVQRQCDIKKVLIAASADAAALCRRHLGAAPSVAILGDPTLTAAYIPEHLYKVLFEVLKNSMRATVEHHHSDPRNSPSTSSPGLATLSLPPIRATIRRGAENVVEIADGGGGLDEGSLERLWLFAASSAPRSMGGLAGNGVGLPLSRVYARYWGGELALANSSQEQGATCTLWLGAPACSEPPPAHLGLLPRWCQQHPALSRAS